MPRTPCLTCGVLTTNRGGKCGPCSSATARGYDAAWQRVASRAVKGHRAEHGDWCPGWGRPAHAATDLTGDHRIPKARGGTSDPSNVAVLCRSCNSRKQDR